MQHESCVIRTSFDRMADTRKVESMRKKSHISLSRFLITNMDKQELLKHKKSFYIGSILPDCMPSFITRRHTFDDTFFIVRKEIEGLIGEYSLPEEINGRFCRKLGVVTHYIADYFTFPHNKNYPGTMREHCQYENILKHQLRKYVQNIDSRRERLKEMRFETIDELFAFIEEIHQKYLMKLSEVKKDIQYIVEVCFEVVDAILHFIEVRASENPLIPQTVG